MRAASTLALTELGRSGPRQQPRCRPCPKLQNLSRGARRGEHVAAGRKRKRTSFFVNALWPVAALEARTSSRLPKPSVCWLNERSPAPVPTLRGRNLIPMAAAPNWLRASLLLLGWLPSYSAVDSNFRRSVVYQYIFKPLDQHTTIVISNRSLTFQ